MFLIHYRRYIDRCRCHGPSGSCNLQICSEKIADNFKQIGEVIYRKYLEAKFDVPNQKVIEKNAKAIIHQRENARTLKLHWHPIWPKK